MRRLLFATLGLAAFAGPAAACINDVELVGHEREFHSQYNKPAEPPAPPAAQAPESGTSPATGLVAGAFGAVLVIGATVVAVRGLPARA